jgi:hemolysin D
MPAKSPKLSDIHEFKPLLVEIEESPVSPLGRATFWMIIIIIAFTGLWSFLGQIEVVVSAKGQVIPDGQVKILQPLDTGIIRQILVKEGDYVKAGQPVVEIDPSTVDPARESTAKNLSYAKLEMGRIAASLGSGSFSPGEGVSPEAVAAQQSLMLSAQSEMRQQLAAKQAELDSIEEQRKSALASKGENQTLLEVSLDREKRMSQVLDLVAKQDYEQITNDITKYRTKLEQAEYELSQQSHEKRRVREEMEQIRQQFRRTNLQELSDKIRTVHDLDGRLKETSFKTAKQRIVSPVDGYVDRLFVHTIGGVVTPAEKLMSIVPANTPLVVKAEVENRDIGFINNGMPVSIKVDTFEYQKYGMFDGKVKLVSRDSHEDDKQSPDRRGPTYDVYIQPITPYLNVDGRKEPLKPGMSLVAEIKVGTRRIIEFFVYPLTKYWHEGMSVR